MKISRNHKTKIYIPILFSIFTLYGCGQLGAVNNPPLPHTEEWQVLKVSDGDSLTVRQTDGQEKKLRLCGIDAPEKFQPLGKDSKASLQKLVDEAGGTVQITEIESDRYGRTVAEIFSSKNGIEKNLNEEQLSSGNAYVYPQYVGKCPNKLAMEKAEAIAQSKKLGVWGGNYQKPWDYRKQMRDKS